MLFRTEPSGVLAISQPTHAWVSGQILRAWDDTLGKPLLLAAEQHDIDRTQRTRQDGAGRELARLRHEIPVLRTGRAHRVHRALARSAAVSIRGHAALTDRLRDQRPSRNPTSRPPAWPRPDSSRTSEGRSAPRRQVLRSKRRTPTARSSRPWRDRRRRESCDDHRATRRGTLRRTSRPRP